MHAASKGHTKLMQLLRERGADIKYTVPKLESKIVVQCESCDKSSSHDFNTSHTYSCPFCNHRIFEFSEAHACVGMSAIHAAAAKGQSKAVQWLLQHGLSVNAQTMVGDTPLMMAVMGGHRETVEHLIENAADVNMLNGDKESALHKAVSESTQNIVRVLCAAGASLAVKNRDGLTPVQLADEKGDTQIIDILSRHAGRAKSTVSAEGSFGYERWQTRPAAPAEAPADVEKPKEEEEEAAASEHAGGEMKKGDGAQSSELGEWGKAGGVGLSGKPREKMEPFKWDDTIPKLADRKSLHMLVD